MDGHPKNNGEKLKSVFRGLLKLDNEKKTGLGNITMPEKLTARLSVSQSCQCQLQMLVFYKPHQSWRRSIFANSGVE